jgi:hypothetical protein
MDPMLVSVVQWSTNKNISIFSLGPGLGISIFGCVELRAEQLVFEDEHDPNVRVCFDLRQLGWDLDALLAIEDLSLKHY